jgi:outer membrane protein TolC
VRWISVVVTCVLLAPAVHAQPAKPLSIDDAVALALTRNERAAISDLNVVVADAGVEKARSAFLPLVNANGAMTWRPRDKPGDIENGALTVTQPLFAPSAFPLYDQAKHALRAQHFQTIDDKRQLAFDAAKAYLAVRLADAVVQAAQHKLDTAKSNLNDTTAQFNAQLVSSNDVTRAQVSYASAVRELVTDQGALEAAWVTLEFTVNARIPRVLVSPDAVFAAGERPVGDIEGLVKQAIARRPDLVAKKDTALAAHDFAREPRWRMLPTLALVGQLTDTSNAPPNGHAVDGTIALTANWPIYDGGTRYADARSRDAQAAIADLNTETLARSVDAQVRSAAVLLASAQAGLAAAKDALDASHKSTQETGILYRQGLAKAIELIDATESEFIAAVNFAAAQDSVAQAYMALRQALGQGPLEGS